MGNEYLKAKIEHVLVDPDVNFVYTRRKRRLLGLEDALDPSTPNSSTPSDNTKKVAFPTDGWGAALAKSPLFTCAEMDRHIANSEKKSTKKANITRCLQDFEKPRLFWLMNSLTRSRLAKIKASAKCFHSFKVLEEPHNLKLASCIVSVLFTRVLCAM